jgi:hypothetical protein
MLSSARAGAATKKALSAGASRQSREVIRSSLAAENQPAAPSCFPIVARR